MKNLTSIVFAWLLLFVPQAFAETDCGDSAELEMKAYRGRLDDETRTCLTRYIKVANSSARVQSSFILIVDAYVSGDKDRYGALMQTHLTEYHTTDAEVAYLYATHLWREVPSDNNVLHWARIAIEGRRRWLKNRGNYDRMVRALYDMTVQVSMERAIQAEADYRAGPSEANLDKMEAYRRQARYYLIVAAPCLHYGDCGPYYEVEVEGWAPCDDLVALEAAAKSGGVTSEHLACLRGKYRRPQSPKKRILGVLMDQADTQAEGTIWKELMAWHWNLDGVDDPLLAYRYAEFLVDKGAEESEEALKWAQVALAGQEGFTGRTGRQALFRLHQLRLETAKRILEDAKTRHLEDKNAFTKRAMSDAKTDVEVATASMDKYCEMNACKY
ncbi:MAG: hypothetical protein GWP91_09140 [Rhodobacterales bacterium]|nr:hypothetical protein [Rhodobacterales bacterium]